MAIDNKYRVHEVAKDFGAATKEITEILTQVLALHPKNHMQVLERSPTCPSFSSISRSTIR